MDRGEETRDSSGDGGGDMAGMSSILAAVTLMYSKWGAPAAELLSHFRAFKVVASSSWRVVVVLGGCRNGSGG